VGVERSSKGSKYKKLKDGKYQKSDEKEGQQAEQAREKNDSFSKTYIVLILCKQFRNFFFIDLRFRRAEFIKIIIKNHFFSKHTIIQSSPTLTSFSLTMITRPRVFSSTEQVSQQMERCHSYKNIFRNFRITPSLQRLSVVF
jgi:hypothetical protein